MIGKKNQIEKDSRYSLWCWVLSVCVILRFTVLYRARQGGDFASVDSSAVIDIFLVLCSILLLFVSNRWRYMLTGLRNRSSKWFIGLYFLGVCSSLWSLMPTYSAFRSVQFLSQVLLIFVAVFLQKKGYPSEKKVLIVLVICLLTSFFTTWRGHGYSFSISALHTNTYSAIAAMMVCYCFGEIISLRKQCRRLYVVGGIALCFLIVGTSSGSNIATILGLISVALLKRNTKVLLFVLVFTAILTLTVNKQQVFKAIFPNKSIEQVQTLRGRERLWTMYRERFLQNPLLGEGYAATAKTGGVITYNTHNAYIAVICGMGLTGAVLMLIWLLTLAREIIISVRQEVSFSAGCCGALVAGLFNSLTKSIFGETWGEASLCLIAFLALFAFNVPTQCKNKILRNNRYTND